MVWQRCAYALVGFRHKKHLVRFRKTSSFSLKYLFLSPQHSWKLSHGLFKNIEWFHSYKCWNDVSNCSLWLTSLLAPCLRIWKVVNMYCKHDMTHSVGMSIGYIGLWNAKVSVVAEMLTTNYDSVGQFRLFCQSTQLLFLQVPPTVRSAFSQARLIGLNAT